MTKNQKGVISSEGIRAKVNLSPRLVLDALGSSKNALAYVEPSKIINFLNAPVIQLNSKSPLKQEIRDGWDRVLKNIDFKNVKVATKCLLVSAKKNWNIYDNKINVIETANIIDGANYLHYLVINNFQEKIPMLVIFQSTEAEELACRRSIHQCESFSIHDIKTKVGTEAPRLVIDENWKHVEITSDPFVIKTARGYVAAINVIDKKNNLINHVIVGAKSICAELEPLREKLGSLVGVELKIRKQSSDPQSLYEIAIS